MERDPDPLETMTYVRGAERMITAARLVPAGLFVRFADEREGVIPFQELGLASTVKEVAIPGPYVVVLELTDGSEDEVPWDFARHFVDEGYRRRSEAAAARGRQALGERLRALRTDRRLTQNELAGRAGLSRATIVRIEAGDQLPRFGTMAALARALDAPLERLLPAHEALREPDAE